MLWSELDSKMPYSLRDIGRITCDTNLIIEFLCEKKILKKNYTCCDNICKEVKSKSSDGIEFKCKTYGKRYSIKKASFFFHVRVTLQNLFLLIFLFSKQVTAEVCVRLLVGEVMVSEAMVSVFERSVFWKFTPK